MCIFIVYSFASFISLIIGFVLDILIGDPYFVYHPVRLMGGLIDISEKIIRKIIPKTEKGLINGGKILVFSVCVITVLSAAAVVFISYKINIILGIAAESVLCYFMLAMKSLKTESMRVYYALERGDLQGARKALSMIVGRDTERLDEKGIIKAAVETVAENTSDGVIAPMIYMMIGGAVLGAFYKAVNTMDSMVGYKNEKYLYFGRAAARLDDMLNFIPSRLSAYFMILSAYILRFDAKRAYKIYKRDRYKHPSPNSAHTEAVCAGALGVQLAGNAFYFGKLYEKEKIGDEINDIKRENIKQANSLMYMTGFVSVFVLSALKLFFILRFVL